MINMKKLILIGMVGIVLSGCGEKVDYNWLAGDWSCDSYQFGYNNESKEYSDHGQHTAIEQHLEIIDGKVYDVLAGYLKLPFHETKFDTPYMHEENIEGIIWKGVHTGTKISKDEFILTAESEMIGTKNNLILKSKAETICKRVE